MAPTVRRLLGYMRSHTLGLLGIVGAIVAVTAVTATTVVELAPPWFIRYAVDQLILPGRIGQLGWLAAGLLGLSVVQGLIDFVRLYASATIGQRIVFGLRNAVFGHLSQLSFSFGPLYDRARTGDLRRPRRVRRPRRDVAGHGGHGVRAALTC